MNRIWEDKPLSKETIWEHFFKSVRFWELINFKEKWGIFIQKKNILLHKYSFFRWKNFR